MQYECTRRLPAHCQPAVPRAGRGAGRRSTPNFRQSGHVLTGVDSGKSPGRVPRPLAEYFSRRRLRSPECDTRLGRNPCNLGVRHRGCVAGVKCRATRRRPTTECDLNPTWSLSVVEKRYPSTRVQCVHVGLLCVSKPRSRADILSWFRTCRKSVSQSVNCVFAPWLNSKLIRNQARCKTQTGASWTRRCKVSQLN